MTTIEMATIGGGAAEEEEKNAANFYGDVITLRGEVFRSNKLRHWNGFSVVVGGLFSIAAIVCGAVSLTRPAMWLVLASSISSVLPYCVLLGEYCGCFAKDAPSVDIPDQAAVASFQWRGLKEKFTADKGRADVLDKLIEHGNAIIVFAGVMSACTAPVVPDKPEATVQFVIACLQALAALIIAVIVWKEKKRVDHGELFMIGTAMVMNPTTSAGGVQDREQDV